MGASPIVSTTGRRRRGAVGMERGCCRSDGEHRPQDPTAHGNGSVLGWTVVEDPGGALGGEFERLRAAGLFDASSDTSSQRDELLRYLLERFSVDEILYWAERSNVTGVAARAIDRPPPLISADEAADRAGVTVDAVVELRTALGFPVVDPTVPSMPETVVDDVKTFVLGAELYGHDAALAFARVLGWYAEGHVAGFGMSVVGAMALLVIYRFVA